MKFTKKKNINLKFNFLKISLFLIIFFILGMWTEKYDLLKKPNDFFTKIYGNLYSKVVTKVYDVEKLIIDIDYKNFEKIKNSREIALKNQFLKQNDAKWSSAKLIHNNKKNKIKIRLKGMLNDHWSHPYKWSFYVKIDDDNSSIFNLRRFTLQPPETLNFLKEWLYMKALKKEGLIYHRTKFLELIINGNQYGLYTLQERSMKELIENNNRREGPVIIFSNQERLEEEINLDNLSANKISDYFWRSQIKPIQFKKSYKGTVQEKYLNKAVSLLELFRDKKLSVDEVFDLDQISKIMAIRAIFGSTEFDVDDMKFYYNPVSNLLEPISKEVHSEPKRFLSGFNPWVFNSDNLRYPRQKPFLDLFFNDVVFYEKYLNELNNYSNNNYIIDLIKDNEAEFEEVKKILKLNFPSEELFISQDFKNVSTFIQNTLNPIQKPFFNLLKISNNNLEFKVTNTQILPIEITGLAKENDVLDLKSNFFVGGIDLYTDLYNKSDFQKIVKIECSTIICDEGSLDKIRINYKIFGQENIYSNPIKFWNNNFNPETFNLKLSDALFLLDKYEFIKKIGKNIIIEDQEWNIDDRIVIPKDHKLIIKKGKIKFSKKGQLISFSPIYIEGDNENPVIITSDLNQNSNSKNLNEENGNGILIINTDEESVLNNVIFKNLSAPNVISGKGVLGSINFYQADVKILNAKFYNNLIGDDYINIIRSNFHIENSYFEETNSDSIDVDFSKGSIINSKFFMSKNDAIDFSGSEVNLKNINIYGSGDKAISVGEGSIVRAKNILIENSNIGVASKDNSIVYLDNITINDVNIGLAAYIKKIEYGAPEIIASDIKLSNYKNDFISDLNSKIIIDEKVISNINCKKNKDVCSFLIN
jgi:hypothetical protein